jgi:ribonuclease HI
MNHKSLFIYCDGGSRGNPGPAACAFVIKDSEKKIIAKKGLFLETVTNNQAEYQAVILALDYLSKNPDLISQEINIFLDSVLVASQINGLFKIKNSDLRNLLFKIRELESEIKSKIIYNIIPREQNADADLLVNQTLDLHS